MLTTMKKDGATSTAGDSVGRGSKGRLELYAYRQLDGDFVVQFSDYGNYGRLRWEGDFGALTEFQLEDVIGSLQDLLAGKIETTHAPFEDVAEPEGEPEETEPEEAEAEEVEAEACDNEEELFDDLPPVSVDDGFSEDETRA